MNALDFLYVPVAALTAPWWARKARAGWKQRLGHADRLPPVTHPGGRVLLHAVSVGEVSALRELIPLLTSHCEVVVATTTDTGLQRALDLFGKLCPVVRYPLDFSRSVRRFLDAVQPTAVGLVELEVWPNFIRECVRRDIPVGVINGRLSTRSFKGYRKIRPVLRRTFASLSFAGVQDNDYFERFLAMGVPRERLSITGTMKWDAARIQSDVPGAAELALELGIDRSKPLIVAGSTGPGEEALLHAACPHGVQLLCAPRKPERFDEAAAALPGCVRRTARTPAQRGATRFLLDTIGELRKAYALADVVVVGRSFFDQFGSDPIEPAALGKPVVIGPAVSDFANIVAAFESADAIIKVHQNDLARTLAGLINDPARRSTLAERAIACVRQNQGATQRSAQLLIAAARR
ncbi:MAG: glycosyltransferase N-terminal domain-containing protein [Planctomycetota bacterium]|nr:glycosyltransferase N-terminal domain-containing protein [Planctomycetota bacterium]